MFWRTIQGLCDKRCRTDRTIKDQNGVLLSIKENILSRWWEYFKDLLNPVTTTPSDTKEVQLQKENAITAAEAFLAVKLLKAVKDVMKSDLKCSKFESRSSLANSCVSCGLVFLEGVERLTNRGDQPHTWKRRTSLSPASWKCIPSTLKNDAEIIEPKMENTQCGFRPGCNTKHQILLSSKPSKNLCCMPKTSTHVLSTSREHKPGFLVKRFGDCW